LVVSVDGHRATRCGGREASDVPDGDNQYFVSGALVTAPNELLQAVALEARKHFTHE
jgi:hypothetical protein